VVVVHRAKEKAEEKEALQQRGSIDATRWVARQREPAINGWQRQEADALSSGSISDFARTLFVR